MSATLRHSMASWLPPVAGGLALLVLGATGFWLALPDAAPRPRHAEAAAPDGMGRAMSVLERDLATWHRLVAPDGAIDLTMLRRAVGDATRVHAGAAANAPAATPTPRAAPDHPLQMTLMLAAGLTVATVLAGLAALLLERQLLAPFRALRATAAAMAAGGLSAPVPGLARADEAGALARALEGFRIAALRAQARQRHEAATPASLGDAASRIGGAARRIEEIAAAAAALAALSAAPGCRQTAQGVRDLARQTSAIRAAAADAVAAIDRIGVATQDRATRAAPGMPAAAPWRAGAVRVLEDLHA